MSGTEVMKALFKKVKYTSYYMTGKKFLENRYYIDGEEKYRRDISERPIRTAIINCILPRLDQETTS